MFKRSSSPVFLVPVAVYIVAMTLLGVFVTHPPLLGWIGLGILAVGLAAATTGLVTFLERGRASANRLHPREGFVHRLLVVSTADVEPEELASAVRLRVLGRYSQVRIVAPVMSSPPHFLAEDEENERVAARHRLEDALNALAGNGIAPQGSVGPDDPLQAIADELARFAADEILAVTVLPARRTWLDCRLESDARDRFGIPVTAIYGPATRAHAAASNAA